jgi:hypothetical protein
MEDHTGIPAHRAFGYVSGIVGALMIIAGLLGYVSQHRLHWQPFAFGVLFLVLGTRWLRNKGL